MAQPVVHVEVIGADPGALRSFYGELFGWDFAIGDATTPAVSEPGEYGFVDGSTSAGVNAALHAEAPGAEDTDWPQVAELYRLLERLDPGPVVTLNRAVAEAVVHGPEAGLALLEPLRADDRMSRHHRLHAVRAHLLEMAGEVDAARAEYREAARRTTSLPEQRHLQQREDRLARSRAAPTTPSRTGE